MNATKHLGLVLFLTLAAGVATAAITHESAATKAAALQETAGEIPRVVITASRQVADSEDCDNAIPRVVVVARRADLAKLGK
jgi:hypothetical protein